jgi:hydroxymethylpyrimidine pyrophosphatase-like HAD family hydrolase
MRIVCDIDGTLCTIEQEYKDCKPMIEAIKLINSHYEKGDIIILHTGRHWNSFSITRQQLDDWGIKYHTLMMGKPVADGYIDDKSFKSVQEFENEYSR